MLEKTPLVEPCQLDEAFLTSAEPSYCMGRYQRKHFVRLVNNIEAEIGITVSVGLSYTKFLAKIASNLNKPRGLAIIGRADAIDFLSPRSVETIWGVGKPSRPAWLMMVS